MTNILCAGALLVMVMAGTAYGQDPPTLPPPADPAALARSDMNGALFGSVEFGARVTHIDGDEARFQRYRDLRPGAYATNLLLGRRTADWNVEAQAWNVGYRDQRYQVDLQRVGRLSATFLWDQIPLFISRDTRTLFTQTTPGVFRLEDALQQDIQSTAKTLRDFEDQATRFELRTVRKIGQAGFVVTLNRALDVVVDVKNTTRQGAIPFGATFGLNNAVELPVPVDTRTTDVRTALEWASSRGMVRLGWDGSAFDNEVDSVIWDNPVRFGPDIAGGPSQGRMGLPPSNTLTYVHGTGAITMPRRSRLTAYVALGQGRNDEALLPFTINTAIPPVALSRTSAAARTHMTIAQLTFAIRPSTRLSVNARYRFSDIDVQTPVFERLAGSVAYDTTFNAVAGPSEYHSVERATFDADGVFQLTRATSVKVGFGRVASDYTHRLWERTRENVVRASVDTVGNALFSVRGAYERRDREGQGLETETLSEAGELLGMRHYDVANRRRQRATLIADVMPGGVVGITASAGVGRDDYPDSPNGLQSYDSSQYSAGLSVTPDDRYNLTASYGWEDYTSLQRSRTATTAADQADPLRDWTMDYTGKVRFLEAALDVDRAIARTAIRLSVDWSRSNDAYLYGLVAGSPLAVPEQLPRVKNAMVRGELNVTYAVARNLRLGVAYWYDDYDVQDFALGPTTLTGIALPAVQEGQPIVATNALLLGYLYRPYTAQAGFVRLTVLF